MPFIGFKFSDYFKSTDHKLHSPKILGATIVAISMILGGLTFSELVIDLKGTTAEFILPFFIVNFTLALLFYSGLLTRYVGQIQVIIIYLVIELNFIIHPDSYHIMLYWFPFIHIVVLLISGMKYSHIWFGVTVVTIILDGLFVKMQIGNSYFPEVKYDAFISVGVLFCLGIYFSVSLLYRLMGDAYQKMKSSQLELLSKNETISQLNKELYEINSSLDEAVNERTKELEKQNKQLIEYAFINSHLLRAPLAKILGSSYLISSDQVNKADPTLLKTLVESSKELDHIIHKIDDLLKDGGSFDRKDIEKLIREKLGE